jgi:ubiquinone/menaquinone biosynthesis C-methylase UbiE
MWRLTLRLCLWSLLITAGTALPAQEKSVRPGINEPFRDPNVEDFIGKFEIESREVFTRRADIVAACGLRPGQTVADVGAGTGLFTRLFSPQVGETGRVIAVDIAQKFLDHIESTTRQAGLRNIETRLCQADSIGLPPNSVDLVFICDTYHHFEFPTKTMQSVFRALKPGGRVVLIDFRRVEGQSTDWVLTHVRAGQEVFEAEVAAVGFKKLKEPLRLKENYLMMFQKPENAAKPAGN